MGDIFGMISHLLLLGATGAAVRYYIDKAKSIVICCVLSILTPYFSSSQVAIQVLYVMLDCEFLKYTNSDGEELFLGLFQRSEMVDGQAECIDYNWRAEESVMLKTAQVSILFAVIGGGVGFLVVFIETCCVQVCCSHMLESMAFGMAQLFTALTFIVYGSSLCQTNGGCSNSTGGTYNFAAVGLYFFAGVLMCCTPKPKPFLTQVFSKKEKSEPVDEGQSVGAYLNPSSDTKAKTGLELEEGWSPGPQGRSQFE
jgi:hypothetical protein